MLNVAIGIALNSDGQVLISRRQEGTLQAGKWEFPGGKVEPGESVFQALKREFVEEVGIDVEEAHCLEAFTHDYGSRRLRLNFWLIDAYRGNAKGKEGQLIRWCPLLELSQQDLLEANWRILNTLLEQLVAKS